MSRWPLITGCLLFLAGLAGFAVGMAQETPARPAQPAPVAAAPGSPPEFKTLDDQASYAIGLDIGRSLLVDAPELNPDIVARGVTDAMRKAKPLLGDAHLHEVMDLFSAHKAGPVAEKNLKDGQAFLAANKVKPGVQTTESGLQYFVTKSGTGKSPQPTDVVQVHYHGTLIDGKVIDSSVERKKPAEFPVNRGGVPGLTEALLKMKVGDKWRLYIPTRLAYGPQGTSDGKIPPCAVLIFDVELLEVK
jgi:FKBP-type peptidyl-prolyl cis-trans isomerase